MTDSLFPGTKAVKRLRKYFNDILSELDDEHVRAELFGESDRAKVILSASLIDDLLDYRIEQHIKIPVTLQQRNYIFRNEGPLGRFAYKIDISYVFGLIEKSTEKQLHLLRELRNACAHSKFKLTFDAPELGDVAKQLLKPLGVVALKEDSGDAIRTAFLAEMQVLTHTLIQGSREEAKTWMRRFRPPPDELIP
jgi:hypothetical protein